MSICTALWIGKTRCWAVHITAKRSPWSRCRPGWIPPAAFKPYITDVGQVLREALSCGKNVLMEAQLGALRDLDYGIYPYTSSSSPLAGYAPIGCGLPSIKLDKDDYHLLRYYNMLVVNRPASLFLQ